MKKKFIKPTAKEDAAIARGIAKDRSAAPELDDRFFKRARRGRPKLEAPKESVNIRLDPEILRTFRATGPGWQTRINNAIAQWLKRHDPTKL